jgi:DNA-binding MarR family transcriptional regulator
MHELVANKIGALAVLLSDRLDDALGDLSASAAAMLLILHHHPGMTTTDAAKIAGIAQPTAVRLVDGLVRRGLVERQERAGRSTSLRLMQAGRARARGVQAARHTMMASLLETLPAAERKAFERAIDRVLAAATTSRTMARTTCRLCDHAICIGARCPIGTRASEIEGAAGA